MVSHFLATLSSLWPVPKLIISAPQMEALSIALLPFLQKLTTLSLSLFTETGTYSAGVLYAYENDSHCQKLCFEQDEYGVHRVVSVRTIGTSDDNNHQAIIGPWVYMRLSSDGTTLGSYFSENGEIWHMARLYKNDFPGKLLLGLSFQSPKDDAHTCYFTEISLKQEAVANFRIGKLNGE